MNRFILISIVALSLSAAGCKKDNPGSKHPDVASTDVTAKHSRGAQFRSAGDRGYSENISLSDANQMIGSYLSSVNYPATDNKLRALSFDADSLRAYLADPSIKTVKFMFAHQMDYIADGNYGVNAEMNPDAQTFIIVGQNFNGDYILNSQNGVYEHAMPCPSMCVGGGNGRIE